MISLLAAESIHSGLLEILETQDLVSDQPFSFCNILLNLPTSDSIYSFGK